MGFIKDMIEGIKMQIFGEPKPKEQEPKYHTIPSRKLKKMFR